MDQFEVFQMQIVTVNSISVDWLDGIGEYKPQTDLMETIDRNKSIDITMTADIDLSEASRVAVHIEQTNTDNSWDTSLYGNPYVLP